MIAKANGNQLCAFHLLDVERLLEARKEQLLRSRAGRLVANQANFRFLCVGILAKVAIRERIECADGNDVALQNNDFSLKRVGYHIRRSGTGDHLGPTNLRERGRCAKSQLLRKPASPTTDIRPL